MSLTSKGQVSRQTFEKAVDFVNYRTVRYLLNDNSKRVQDDYGDDRYEYPTYNEIRQMIPPYKSTIRRFAEEIESIKNEEYTDYMKDKSVIKLLSEDIFNDFNKYQNLYSLRIKNGFPKYKIDLKKGLIRLLNSEISSSDRTLLMLTDSLRYLSNQISTNRIITANRNHFFTGCIVFLLAINFLLFFYTYREISQIRSYYLDKSIEERSIINYNSEFQSTKEIQILKDDIKTLRQAINANVKCPDERYFWNNLSGDTFFMSLPNTDRSFNSSSATSVFKEGSSIYQFKKVSNQKAKFQIVTANSAFEFALRYPDRALSLICDPVNTFSTSVRSILTIEEGVAELKDSKWIVIIKPKIIYES